MAVANSAHIKRQITERQARALFNLAALFNQEGARALDIGTYHGFSASIIAQAMPLGKVTTLNPREPELVIARQNLEFYKNVEIVCIHSWDYLATYDGLPFSFIFVDGHHNRIQRDMGWWDKLEAGGLMLFHDYNKPGSAHDSAVVRVVLDEFVTKLGRPFDIVTMDESQDAGMVGLYYREKHVNGE